VSRAPSIAVVIPNFNDERYLARCLRSVLDQDAPPDEVLVVDDASTDNSVATIERLIAGHSRARLFRNPRNLGANITVNESLSRVQSDYVLLLSANDFVLPGMFARARGGLTQSPGAGLWSAMCWLVDEEDRVIRLHPSPVVSLRDRFLPAERCVRLAHRYGNWFTGTTLTYRREVLRAIGGFDPGYGAPADLMTALTIASLHGAAYCPAPCAVIRIQDSSYSGRHLNDISATDAMLAHIRSHGRPRSPGLFTDEFCRRTVARYHFAAVRASAGALLPAVAARQAKGKAAVLRLIEKGVPAVLGRLRVVLAFIALRPFDIVPSLERLAGWVLVRTRLFLTGHVAPQKTRD
jgi:glycosyltransferase involved in cell wall biosynthesis